MPIKRINVLLYFALINMNLGCTKLIKTILVEDNSVPEETYCSTVTAYPGGVTITGMADYEYRLHDDVGGGLGAIEAGTLPIRAAEVQVIDSAGNIVQCTETNADPLDAVPDGQFEFDMPNDGEIYTVKINSRSYNSYNKASVLKNPSTNTYYSITDTFVSNATQNIGTTTALADEGVDSQLRGGAFFILDQIFDANEYLLDETSALPLADKYSVDHKVKIYWAKGVNPRIYLGGDASDTISFYLPGEDELYICGGVSGDVATTDTDHFDKSVILHEYGHFLEDNYATSDSPGGAHFGIYIIDPRLAWSEGFSSYFASAVTGDSVYRDTVGYEGTSSYGIYYDIEINEDDSGDSFDDMQADGGATGYTSNLGEGIFREWAVARLLLDATDTNDDADPDGGGALPDPPEAIAMPFSEFWQMYTQSFSSDVAFREMGLFLSYQDTNGATDISSLLSLDEVTYPTIAARMVASRMHYGTEDEAANPGPDNDPSNTDCQFNIKARSQVGQTENGSLSRSNLFYSNDFYYINHPGGTLTVNLFCLSVAAVDLDLYIYKDGYTFGSGSDILTKKVTTNSCNNSSIESISINAPAGKYMANVNYYTGGVSAPFTEVTYHITINGNQICVDR